MGMDPLQGAGRPATMPALTPGSTPHEAAKEFEAMFLGQVVDEMLSTVNVGSFGGGNAEEQWRSFLSDAIGRSISDQGGTGIAKSIEGAISRYRDAVQS